MSFSPMQAHGRLAVDGVAAEAADEALLAGAVSDGADAGGPPGAAGTTAAGMLVARRDVPPLWCGTSAAAEPMATAADMFTAMGSSELALDASKRARAP